MDDKDIIDITEKLKDGGGDMMNRFETFLPLIVLVIILASWLWTGIRIVQPGEVGVVLTFGKYTRTSTPGLNFIIPWPIQEMQKVSLTKIRREEIGSRSLGGARGETRKIHSEALMLTGDENIVSANMIVQYRVRNPMDYLFNVYNQKDTIKKAAEASLREIVGKNKIDAILTDERALIQDSISENLIEILKSYKLGVEIINVQLQDVFPPERVEASFKDVASAREDRERVVNQSEGFHNDMIPKAEGEADAILERAMAYKDKTIKNAVGETSRFNQVYESYVLAKEITRTRIFLEVMEDIYMNANKIIMEGTTMEKTTPYVPVSPNLLKGGSN